MSAEQIAQPLACFLRDCTGASEVRVDALDRLSGGAIQQNYAVVAACEGGSHPGLRHWVVRCDAPTKVAVSMSREQEFRVLQAAHSEGVTVPEPLWLCVDPAVLGTPFYVMTRVQGKAQARELVRMPWSDSERRALVVQLGKELARIHRVQPPCPELAFLTEPQPPASEARVRQMRAALTEIPTPHPVLEWALNWLEDRAPSAVSPVLCHGDFRTGNYMVHEGRVSGILDWEFASWSDPMEDLGWLCARSWRFGAFYREVGGLGDKVDLFAAYAAAGRGPVDADRVLYWEAMAMVRWAVIALQQGQRHSSGREPSLELALTGRLVPEMEQDLLDHIRRLDTVF